MPCPHNVENCPDRQNGVETSSNKDQIPEVGIDFTTRVPTQTYVINGKGQRVSITEPIVTLKNLPLTWGLNIEVKGIVTRVHGSDPYEVVNNIKAVYNENNVDIEMTTIWYNCNIEWATRTSINNLKASLQTLLYINSNKDESPVTVTRVATIQNQGAKLWGGLQAYLTISEEDFIGSFVNYYINMVRDWLYSNVGCKECAKHLDDNIEGVDFTLITRDEAREWVFNTMNAINKLKNKPVLTKDKAYKLNYWN